MIAEAANHLLGLEDGKKRFLDIILSLNKAHSLCNTLDEVQDLEKEIAFFNSIKTIINKYTSVDQKRQRAMKNSILKQLLDNALVAEGVDDIFSMAGLDRKSTRLNSCHVAISYA